MNDEANVPLRDNWDHGGEVLAVVEAPFEFGKGTRQMLLAHRLLGADDRRLDVAKTDTWLSKV